MQKVVPALPIGPNIVKLFCKYTICSENIKKFHFQITKLFFCLKGPSLFVTKNVVTLISGVYVGCVAVLAIAFCQAGLVGDSVFLIIFRKAVDDSSTFSAIRSWTGRVPSVN